QLRAEQKDVALIGAILLATALTYKLPPGWVDLTDPSVDARHFPSNTVNEAHTGKYKIYAIDPNNLSTTGANALFNVIEAPEKARITQPILDRSMKEAEALAKARGYTWKTIDAQVAQLEGVNIGVVNSTLSNAAGTLRMVQYFIPGEEKAATLTYGCKPEMFSDYQAIFPASAMATTGAYAHGFKWGLALKIMLIV